ncbi:TNF receptor-associated factor 4 isoform X1 [Physeter macrocephalus]|uniref:TNF receptor-associated factor 4 isoform X1 n=1 Tax=Physeter macrocephalus TaxID=9755 RepID=A0A455AWB8_PHYMC|nr:TNF receptor-associated factor 4 isoform X1 [Physeter catodon]|eukprot:XP_028340842.1 TNF receptor-associated factor 4 isoform X1 [Physeter catodon]
MPGFDYKFLEKPKRRLLCPLCGKPMREPVQVSTCGHRFCDTCLQEFLSEGVFKCPEDQLPLDYAKIYPDPELEVQVLGLPIRCIHSEEGCRWSGPLRHLQGHLNTCSFNVVPCPNRCPAKLSRRDLPAHLQHDCPKRRLKCEFCGCDFSGEAFESHEGVCPQESVYCENKCGARMMRRLLAQHATSECPKRTQPCTYCTKEFVFDTIQSHQYQCPRLPVPCPNQCGVGTMAREDLPGHLKDSCSTALVLCPFKDSGCKHRCPKLAMARHVEESVKPHLAMMCALVSRQRQELQELRRELEELSVGSDGVLIWKIGSYGRRLQEAKAKPNLECFSPAFYTHKYGYKLQVSAFLNGNGSDRRKFSHQYSTLKIQTTKRATSHATDHITYYFHLPEVLKFQNVRGERRLWGGGKGRLVLSWLISKPDPRFSVTDSPWSESGITLNWTSSEGQRTILNHQIPPSPLQPCLGRGPVSQVPSRG